MKPRHSVSAIATGTLAIATVGLFAAQPEANVFQGSTGGRILVPQRT